MGIENWLPGLPDPRCETEMIMIMDPPVEEHRGGIKKLFFLGNPNERDPPDKEILDSGRPPPLFGGKF